MILSNFSNIIGSGGGFGSSNRFGGRSDGWRRRLLQNNALLVQFLTIWEATELQTLDLSNNKFSGGIQVLGSLNNLNYLQSAKQQQPFWTLAESLENIKGLTLVDLSYKFLVVRFQSYLQDIQCDPQIIHRDVKAVNILLDEDYVAIVGDFGLAKLLDHRDSNVSTAIRGTVGHIAPEYLSTGQSSEKTDVFGFGILLLELITGQKF
ncbi:hypothetical protein GIB67_001505 [Kingdonia uniflora]|uniref:Protein kinase domain-containing protein n=1 Tax=Kingdonia uniflora TaxID=39325 RepID=A0A7J7NSH8_9MAGN|nr:hypothetical protein GIB67_001505 [Kingdonia uniflora]